MQYLDQVKAKINDNPVLQAELKEEMLRLIIFIESNPKVKYFPLSKIKDITRTDKNDCLSIAIYLSGESIKLLEPRYSYILEDNSEIELTKNEFKFHLYNQDEFLEKDGFHIFPVFRERLFFYFTTSVRIISTDGNWEID